MFTIGDVVRLNDDQVEQIVGMAGQIAKVCNDGTCWVVVAWPPNNIYVGSTIVIHDASMKLVFPQEPY